MTEVETAWVAGLIEGEGCICEYARSHRSKKYKYWQIRVTMTDFDVLEKLLKTTGAGRIYDHPPGRGNRKRAWVWTVYRQEEVYRILEAIYPHMGNRRRGKIQEAFNDKEDRK